MTPRPGKDAYINTDTPAQMGREKRPIPLPEGKPDEEGSDPTPQSGMESGLFKPLENTPIVRNPNATPLGKDRARDKNSEGDDPPGTRADTGVVPTTSLPQSGKRRPG